MSYLSNTPQQQAEMLAAIGVKDVSELLNQVPAALQLKQPLDLPPPLTELELEQHVRSLAARSQSHRVCFMGGGAYDHFIPAVVDEVTGRGEFYTAYTPYQPEASQGSLQAFFEFQTLICQLTGFDASNASLYEGGTAVTEAALMSIRVNGRENKIAISEGVHPEYRQVLETYLKNSSTEIVTIPLKDGQTDLEKAKELIDDQTACLIFQHPNSLGCLEQAEELSGITKQVGALSVVSFDPISLGVLKRPADYGADIGIAEGQPLGIPLQYGGPYLGILACRNEYVRKMPGRLIAKTVDRDGNPCYVLGLQTREQHIRREKATSNICTNQGLLALRATVYLSLLGPEGVREAAELCCQKAHYAADKLSAIEGIELAFASPFFKEFVIRSTRHDARWLIARAAEAGFDIGPDLARWQTPQGEGLQGVLIAVTENRTRAEIDRLAEAFSGK